MDSSSPLSKEGSRQTLWAILGSFVIALVLASLVAGSPFRALGLAYYDYSHEPANKEGNKSPSLSPAANGSDAPK